jgi:hypothetical protein
MHILATTLFSNGEELFLPTELFLLSFLTGIDDIEERDDDDDDDNEEEDEDEDEDDIDWK